MQTPIGVDDLRLVRAIADSGSLAAAARRLNVNHSSAFRRLGALERQLGVRLFERGRAGYSATPAGEFAAATARQVLEGLDALHSRLAGEDMRPAGVVRVTTTDTLVEFLGPLFAAFRREHPGITVELVVSNAFFTLSRRDADVALRPAAEVPGHLVGTRLATVATAPYGAPALGRALQRGTSLQALPWLAPDESLSHLASARWMAREIAPERIALRASSLVALRIAAREGLGAALLPCYLADGDRRLRRLAAPLAEMQAALWLLTHPDLRRVARVRAFTAFAADWLKERRPALEGAPVAAARR